MKQNCVTNSKRKYFVTIQFTNFMCNVKSNYCIGIVILLISQFCPCFNSFYIHQDIYNNLSK
ncbi:hypothetical protein FQN60_012416 [Etheostoma spectabile]|uniref:Uncharacterized protein n=1 Tax=Etheostoma spectabile TaxID=54343 RepID=A0A5J5DPS8_9PERO|nr:hypothetical protein FQN60_012416 [Etheostoma spectabile]